MLDKSKISNIESIITSLAITPSTPGSAIFYQECVRKLSDVFQVRFAFVGILNEDKSHVQTISVWAGDEFVDNFNYSLKGTPCADILSKNKELIPSGAKNLYPEDELLAVMGVESYFGAPLVNSKNEIIGIVSIMDTRPMELLNWWPQIFGIYAKRISTELELKIQHDLSSRPNTKIDELVEDRTSQLRAVNQELESFSYSISHDLRAPLRAIVGFADILNDEYEHVLDETGLDYIKRILVGGEQMGRLIDDLLSLSRITRTDIVKTDVNLSELANEYIDSLQKRSPGKELTVKVAQNIMANADPGLIVVVVTNLMNNAWKYSQKIDHVKIEFGMQRENGEDVYYVQDNGVGFEMQYADKIFSAFQRLHDSKDYEGSGIGLATVQRIIHRHGGQVWAKSKPDQGAIFYFTL